MASFRRRRGGALTSPAALFRDAIGSPAGAWFDPSDRALLYQDAEGTTPAYLPGDPVGLMLDKHEGTGGSDAFGADLSGNSDFADGSTGWSTQAGWTISGGVATVDSSAAGTTMLRTDTAVESGAFYLIAFTINSVSGSGLRAVAGTNTSGSNITTPGTYSLIVQATGSSNGGGLYAVSNDTVAEADNVVVRKLTRSLSGLGPELVTNGGFDTDTDWTKGTGWTIGSGVASCDGTQVGNSNLTQAIGAETGTFYFITYTVTDLSAGTVRPYIGGTGAGVVRSSPGTYSELIQASGSNVFIQANTDFVGSVDNISVRKLPGNHALQDVNDDYRPTLARHPDGGVRNLIDSSSNPTTSDWVKAKTTAVWGAVTAPDGSSTANILYDTTQTATYFELFQYSQIEAGETYTQQYYVKVGAGLRYVQLIGPGAVFGAGYINYDLQECVITAESAGTGLFSGTIEDAGDGWCLISITSTALSTNSQGRLALNLIDGPTTGRGVSRTGDAANYLYVWGAQLEVGTSVTSYQNRVDQYDITETGKRDIWYLDFDGVDDYLYIPSLDMSGTDAVSVFAGVYKINDGVASMVYEHTGSILTKNGVFHLQAPSTSYDYRLGSKGTESGIVAYNGIPAPSTNVITCISDISEDVSTLRADGVQIGDNTDNQGTGSYASDAFYIGSRGGSTFFFNGNIYGLTVLGRLANSTEIAGAEHYMARKAGITI